MTGHCRVLPMIAAASRGALRRARACAPAERDALRRSERRFRAIVECSDALTLLVGADGAIVYASPAAEWLLGRAPDDLTGASLSSLTAAAGSEPLARIMGRAGERGEVELELRHADGTRRTVEGTATNLLGDDAVEAVVISVGDVTEQRRHEGELAELAFRDPLTGLANRALLHERIGQAAQRAARDPDLSAAMLLIDLDDFKAVNDGLGHAEGDKLLVAVARRLERTLRAGDTVARLGGDEFVIFAEFRSGSDRPTVLAQRVMAALEAPFALGGGMQTCRASVGVRCASPAELDAHGFLRDADLAMYSAKAAGKGAWALFEPGDGRATRLAA